MEKIDIVFISDKNYLVNTTVALTSLKMNKEERTMYVVHLIVVDVPEIVIEKIVQLEDAFFKIEIVYYEHNMREFYIKDFNVTPVATIKFMLADIFPEIDKVLYLDGDIIAQKDLSSFFSMSLDECYAAVVRDGVQELRSPNILQKLGSNLPFYFNSGMMLLNLKKMREEDIKSKLIDYRKNGINYFMDQDALNVVFNGNVKFVSCYYNYLISFHECPKQELLWKIYNMDNTMTDGERMQEATIIHLAGLQKPWITYVPYATDLFMFYYRKSPFSKDEIYKPTRKEVKVNEQYLFPFELVEKGSRIVMWGAGVVGKSFEKQLRCSNYCELIQWVDECWEAYNKDDMSVMTPEKIDMSNVDIVVIAIKKREIAFQIMNSLRDMGIEERKIVWRYPVIQE